MRDPTLFPPKTSAPLGHLFSGTAQVLASAEPGGTTGLQRPRVLIVEDNLLLALDMEEALTEASFDVIAKAVSAEQAVECAKRYSPALVIMDIRLEGARDGIDAAAEILRTLGIRAIFASSASALDFPERARAVKPLGWLIKPYDMADLVAAVRAALVPDSSIHS
jgi:DNA-binding NarL/FixJ family response regulator